MADKRFISQGNKQRGKRHLSGIDFQKARNSRDCGCGDIHCEEVCAPVREEERVRGYV